MDPVEESVHVIGRMSNNNDIDVCMMSDMMGIANYNRGVGNMIDNNANMINNGINNIRIILVCAYG